MIDARDRRVSCRCPPRRDSCRQLNPIDNLYSPYNVAKEEKLEMWANAQRDGRPAEYRWRPLFNAAKFG